MGEHCFEIFRLHYQSITSPTSPLVQSVFHEDSRKDRRAELVFSTFVF